MDQNISEGSHPLQFAEKFFRNNLLLGKNLQNLAICLWLPVATIGDDMVANIQQAFYREVQLALGGTMNKRIFLKVLRSLSCTTFSV